MSYWNIMFARLFFSTAVLGVSLSFGAKAADLPAPAKRKVDFAGDIQPIFTNSCYECHAGTKQKGGLRLDDKALALKGGDTGPLFVAHKSAESLIVQVVAGLRDDMARMPKKKTPLTDDQIGLIRAWIDQGADWAEASASPLGISKKKDFSKHWAFKAPVRPKTPSVKDKSWVRNPIDSFVLARLEKEGLKPSPEAAKETLLRRLSLDLIGLPPSIAEMDAFLADKSKDAYEKQVDRLLASPHYGERWGRLWLDAARYADSDGFEKDKMRFVWFYRDWVVNALNNDMPYDEFVTEQIAGDEMQNDEGLMSNDERNPEGTARGGAHALPELQGRIVATGFLRNSMINEEGGVDPEQFRMDAMFDRMDCIGKSVLGLTIQCCQCHDHKYDPFKQEEYYKLFAFLNNDYEQTRVVYTPEQLMKVSNLRREMRETEEGLRHTTADWEKRMADWEASVSTGQPDWIVLRPTVNDISTGGQKYMPQPDGSFIAGGYAPTKHTAKFVLTNDLRNVTAFRLELMTDHGLPCNGPGRSFKGTCALTEFKVEAQDALHPTNKVIVKFVKATSDVEQPVTPLEPNFEDKSGKERKTGPVSFAIDGDNETAWGIDLGPGRRNEDRKAVFECAKSAGFTNGTIWTIELAQNHGGWNSDDLMNNNLGRFRISVCTNGASETAEPPGEGTGPTTTPPGPKFGTGPKRRVKLMADPVPKAVRDILAVPQEKRTPAQVAKVFSYWRTTQPEFAKANEKIDGLWKQWPEGATTLTLMTRDQRRETHILKRGDWLKPTEAVTAGAPSFMHKMNGTNGTRLDLARWLVDKKSPTTARAFVNRAWQAFFGIGIVATAEDFGMQSEAPSHPELLDWLATEFMNEKPNWSIKRMHRLIVTSATYRQDSKVNPELYAKDPYNRLLARGPRFRVDAELVRDVALSASGLLNEKMGGPSVFSPAPEFLFQPPTSYAPFPWKQETGPDRYRRALYTFRRRSTPYPVLQVYDAPNGDVSCVRRMRSNTPLQALASLNESVFVECARSLARKTIEEGGASDRERIDYVFRRALARHPTTDEETELMALLTKEKNRIGEGWVNPSEIGSGETTVPSWLPKGATPTQLGAYAVVSRVLLNLDEAITKE